MTVKEKKDQVFKMRATDHSLVSRSRKDVVKAMNQIIRRNQGKVIDETLIKNLAGEGGRALVPYELLHDLDKVKKRNKSIRQFIDVVPVREVSGTFATDFEGNANKVLVEFESGGSDIAEEELKLNGVKWAIKPYGSFTPITQALIGDSAYDLTKFFKDNHAGKAIKTENKLVFDAIKTGLITKELLDVTALSTSLNKDIDPALEKQIVVITNQDGFEVLRPSIGYHIDKNGELKAFLDKYPVEVYSNDDLPSAAGTIPVVYGSLKNSVKLFDLEKTEILLVRNPFGIRSTVSVLRGIEHFDVKLMPNSTQTIYGEIPTA